MAYTSDNWRDVLRDAGWSTNELWLAAFALGSSLTRHELEQFLDGQREPGPTEHNVVAVALNEHLADLGHDHPIPYVDDPSTASR